MPANSTRPDVPVPSTSTLSEPSQPVTPAPSATESKWWGHSVTIWGVLVTTASVVVPAIAQAMGIDLPVSLLRDLAAELGKLAQAAGGVIGIAMTIYGRIRAERPIGRRELTVRV